MFNWLFFKKKFFSLTGGNIECPSNFPRGITLAKKTIVNFVTKALRLYEQEPPHTRMRRLGEYIQHWFKWLNAGF
jgi:hypothetical protein